MINYNRLDYKIFFYSHIFILFSLHFIFLTDVEKLYHICQKALAHIWKSFTTTVKQLKSHEFYR